MKADKLLFITLGCVLVVFALYYTRLQKETELYTCTVLFINASTSPTGEQRAQYQDAHDCLVKIIKKHKGNSELFLLLHATAERLQKLGVTKLRKQDIDGWLYSYQKRYKRLNPQGLDMKSELRLLLNKHPGALGRSRLKRRANPGVVRREVPVRTAMDSGKPNTSPRSAVFRPGSRGRNLRTRRRSQGGAISKMQIEVYFRRLMRRPGLSTIKKDLLGKFASAIAFQALSSCRMRMACRVGQEGRVICYATERDLKTKCGFERMVQNKRRRDLLNKRVVSVLRKTRTQEAIRYSFVLRPTRACYRPIPIGSRKCESF